MKTIKQLEKEIKVFEKAYEDWNNKDLSVKEVEKAERRVHKLTDEERNPLILEPVLKQTKEICKRIEKDIKWYEDYEMDGEKDKIILEQSKAIARYCGDLLSKIQGLETDGGRS